MASDAPLKFACIGLDHPHIIGLMDGFLAAGAECVAFHSNDDAEPLGNFRSRYPRVPRVDDKRRILENPEVELVACSGIPAVHAEDSVLAMRHGKAVVVDKPGVTSFEQLRLIEKVQKETGVTYSVCYSERFRSPSAVAAGRLIAEGAIGQVVQTIGMGPHRHNPARRRPWFYDREQYGGILVDLASHQIDQFLSFTGSRTARIVGSAIGNLANPDHPGLEDFGEINLHSEHATGYIRVDWLTPDGLAVWGDGRIFILGTEGFIELRKYIDVEGRPGANHLFITDNSGSRHIDCSNEPLPYFRQVIDDVRTGGETAMSLSHCLEVCRLALEAQEAARILPPRNEGQRLK